MCACRAAEIGAAQRAKHSETGLLGEHSGSLRMCFSAFLPNNGEKGRIIGMWGPELKYWCLLLVQGFLSCWNRPGLQGLKNLRCGVPRKPSPHPLWLSEGMERTPQLLREGALDKAIGGPNPEKTWKRRGWHSQSSRNPQPYGNTQSHTCLHRVEATNTAQSLTSRPEPGHCP